MILYHLAKVRQKHSLNSFIYIFQFDLLFPAALYKLEYLAAFWPLSKKYGVRDISGHSFHGAAPILLSFQPAAGTDAPKASIAEFGPNRYVEIRHYRDQFNFAAKSFSFVMYLGPSTVDGPILEYDSVGGRLGFHMWIQASQL